ncbi:MAG: hypothetical protein QOE03_3234 [Micromonosporaceae bacterium]|nr:hypothetical protein [Micromonosporaceae bacterium]
MADYLDDPEFDIRVTAALAPEMTDRADATEILVAGSVQAATTGPGGANSPAPHAGDTPLEYANSIVDPSRWRGYSLAELIAVFKRIAETADAAP